MPVRAVKVEDADAILELYTHYIKNTSITFETEVPPIDEMRERIRRISSVFPWFVFEEVGQIKGYTYASKHRDRAAYRWSVDFAVYVEFNSQGKGIGRHLYTKLIETAAGLGYYNAFGVITLPNAGSIALHEACGFTLAGVTTNTGYKLGGWHDVGIWQLQLRESAGEPAEPVRFDGSAL